MPIYAVYYLTTGEEEPTFHAVENLVELINVLLDEWVASDADMQGVMSFLRAHGIEPPVEDDDVMGGEYEESAIVEAADGVRNLVATSASDAEDFLAAIATSFRIEEIEEIELPDKVQDYLIRFLTSGAFGGAPKGLTREDAMCWLEVPTNKQNIQEEIAGWKPAELAAMEDEDLAAILLVGPLWAKLMDAVRGV